MKIAHIIVIHMLVIVLVSISFLVGSYTTTRTLEQMYETVNHEKSMVRIPYKLSMDSSIENYYRGTVINVVDGDTVDIRIEMGFNIFAVKRFRLSGINAPEMSDSTNGIDSKSVMEKLILGKDVIVNTYYDHTDKYGRFLATIFSDDGQTNINETMIRLGKAEVY